LSLRRIFEQFEREIENQSLLKSQYDHEALHHFPQPCCFVFSITTRKASNGWYVQRLYALTLLTSTADILNYALTLEHLEDTFYRQGLANFSASDFSKAGFSSLFYDNIQTVASDERTHVQFLTSALTAAGAKPVAECKYNFGVTDVKGFVMLASVLEGKHDIILPSKIIANESRCWR
jgi:hypothetical protein